MTDADFVGDGKRFHRRSSRVLKSCTCDVSVDNPNAKICVQPARHDLVLGEVTACFTCNQTTWPQGMFINHDLSQDPDSAADGYWFEYEEDLGGGNTRDNVLYLRTYHDLIMNPAPVNWLSFCRWQFQRYVSYNTTIDLNAADPKDIVTFSDFEEGNNPSLDEQDPVFTSWMWGSGSAAITPRAIKVESVPIAVRWRRQFVGATAVVDFGITFPGSDAQIELFTRRVEVPLTDIVSTCSTPPVVTIGGTTGVTVDVGTGGV